jgi:hypothetical protein
LCFAYRYQYVDNEYSATSLFTTPAYEPGQFYFDPDNYYNEGMENIYNGVDIRYLKNMQTLNRKIDSEKIYTKMIFEGKDSLTIVDQSNETRTDNSITILE